jgi:hypothetical protein
MADKGQMFIGGRDPHLLQLPGSACQKAEGLDGLAIFYDVYIRRPGLLRAIYISCFHSS